MHPTQRTSASATAASAGSAVADEPPTVAARPPVASESRRARLVRHGRRTRLYAMAVASVALLVVLTALIAANLQSVRLDWIVGSTRASLVWIVLAAAVLGWLLGIVMSILFRYRTRRPSPRAWSDRSRCQAAPNSEPRGPS